MACRSQAAQRGGPNRHQALSEEMLLLAALAADGADEAMGLLRHFDSEDVDTAQTTFQATAFMSRLHYLFTEAGVGSSGA